MEIKDIATLSILVDEAIITCEAKIQKSPSIILSEADFERLLSNEISNLLANSYNPEGFIVHNQISSYSIKESENQNNRDYQVDILIMKNKDIKDDKILHKEFFYFGDSIAIELKYFRNKDYDYSKIQLDLDKSEKLIGISNCVFFAVVLLKDSSKCEEIEKYFKPYLNKENIHTRVITKEPKKTEIL